MFAWTSPSLTSSTAAGMLIFAEFAEDTSAIFARHEQLYRPWTAEAIFVLARQWAAE